MPVCCNGCLYVDLVPDCLDKTHCWKVVCCETCCKTNPSNFVSRVCSICKCNCCPCCPECKDTRYNCCIFSCCWDNIIWDPCAFFRGPWEGDFERLKAKIEKRQPHGAPQGENMVRE